MQKRLFAHDGVRLGGFALPTVLISSVILLTMLAVAVGAVNSARVALQGQYYNQLAKSAAESGLEMAEACIEDGYLTWDAPLRPGGDCYGLAEPCTAVDCFVMQTGEMRTAFEVASPDIEGDISTVEAKGLTERIRASSGEVWKTHSATFRMQDRVTDVNPGEAVKWKQVAASSSHTCAISTKEHVYCWGNGAYGRLGTGSDDSVSIPARIARGEMPDGVTAQSISTGYEHTCIVGSDGTGYCWGRNGDGQLGDGTTTDRNSPVAVQRGAMPVGSTFLSIANTNQHYTCGIASNNRVYCWGSNAYGQLGNGTKTSRSTPGLVSQGAMPSNPSIVELAGGGYHVCAIVANNGRVYCWGHNASGEGRLGLGTTVSESLTPAMVARGARPADMTAQHIRVGSFNACTVASNSKTYCWGRSSGHQNGNNSTSHNTSPAAVHRGSMPSGMVTNVIGMGANHTCVVGEDNRTYCWGENGYGQLGEGTINTGAIPVVSAAGSIPPGVSIVQMSGGTYHTCGVGSDSEVYCWGAGGSGRLGNGDSSHQGAPVRVATVYEKEEVPHLKEVATGFHHSCALSTDNQVYCWGGNSYGQLGNGGSGDVSTPVAVSQGEIPSGVTVRQVATADYYTCVVASNNKVYCWGRNNNGQLGNSGLNDSSIPVAVSQGEIPSGVTVRQVATGQVHACALTSDSKAYCWGSNANGRLGDGTTTQRTTPVAVSQGAVTPGVGFRSISAGGYHTCAIATDDRAYCWGSNTTGRLGDGTYTQRTTPVAVSQGAVTPGAAFRSISTGFQHTCAIATDNKVYCWGDNLRGRLGDGGVDGSSTPVAVSQGAIPSGVFLRQLSVNHSHTCAAASNGKAYCWGRNDFGQFGTGSGDVGGDFREPVAALQGDVPSGVAIRSVVSGNSFVCSLTTSRNVYCWGSNTSGQLGDGTVVQRTTPVAVSRGVLPSRITVQYYATGGHTCALTSENKAYCWGPGSSGKLGNGATSGNFTTPTPVLQGDAPRGVILRQFTMGSSHTCALASDGKAYCWGSSYAGALGNGVDESASFPAPSAVSQGAIPSSVSVLQLASGTSHTCALASDGKAYCWGNGWYGALGNGSSDHRSTPTAVLQGSIPSNVTLRQVVAGNLHTCALASDSKAYCWGRGGKLGSATVPYDQTSPVAVPQSSPSAIPSNVTLRYLAGGRDHTCALASNNKVYCWGHTTQGALGNGSTSGTINTPVAVSQGEIPSGATIRQLVAGNSHNCVLTFEGEAYCWGNNMHGQLGDGTTVVQPTPVAISMSSIPSGTTIQQVIAGDSHTCIVNNRHETYCWGYNYGGRLGNGTTENTTSATRVVNIGPDHSIPDYLLLGPRRFF